MASRQLLQAVPASMAENTQLITAVLSLPSCPPMGLSAAP